MLQGGALKNWIALMVPQILVKTSGGQCLACFGPVRAPNSKLFSSPVGPGEVIIQSDGCWPPSQTLDVKTLKKSLLQIDPSCRPIVSPTRDSGYSNIQSNSRAPTGFDPAIGPGFFQLQDLVAGLSEGMNSSSIICSLDWCLLLLGLQLTRWLDFEEKNQSKHTSCTLVARLRLCNQATLKMVASFSQVICGASRVALLLGRQVAEIQAQHKWLGSCHPANLCGSRSWPPQKCREV